MTRPQFAQPPNVDESRDPLVPTRMTPEFWGNICLQKEATQEEIRGLPGQIKSDLRSEQKWLLLAQWDPFCCRPRCRVITLQRTRSPLVLRQDCVLEWAKLSRVRRGPEPRGASQNKDRI
jgi:hypothetical protein